MSEKPPKKCTLGLVFYVLLLFLVYGCAGDRKELKDPFFDKWRAQAEKSKGFSPPARKHVSATPEKKTTPAADIKMAAEVIKRDLPTQPTTLEMHNTEVSVLLRALARAVNQNIVINENVKGQMNINVKEAPWDQIFRSILITHGLDYGWEGDIIHIITLEDKDNTLKQLEAEQKIKAKKREIEMVEPLITKIVHVDYGDAKKLKDNIEKFLTEKSEGKPLGSVMVDEHSNALILQAIQSDIDRMIPLIEDLDMPTPQILIEAHIVEANKDAARELGVRWGGLHYNSSANIWAVPNADVSGLTPTNSATSVVGPSASAGYAANFPANLGAAKIAGSGFTLGFIAEEIGSNILAVQLEALEEEGKVNILSSPSITTLDNQKATIEAGDEVPFQTVEDKEVKIQYKKAVLSLEVTPHVIEGKTLKMEIKTSNDELDFTRTVAGNPTVRTKKAETTVILFDGQTTVIGGLSKDKKEGRESGVPVLKDIPLLGYLFKGRGDSSEMQEVLIFITPHILKEPVADTSYPQMPEPESPQADEQGDATLLEKPAVSN